MEFGLLGPLWVGADGGSVWLPASQRVVLAGLLLRANRVVPVDALIAMLWDDTPPSSARNTVQGYVMRLRRRLGPEGGRQIITRAPGYLITVNDGKLDTDRFTARTDEGRLAAAVGDWEGAATGFYAALALWRGDPLADVGSAMLAREEVPRLTELRLRALESRIDADLHLGRHADLDTVARQSGLGAPETLYRIFRRHWRISPGDYRRRFQQKES